MVLIPMVLAIVLVNRFIFINLAKLSEITDFLPLRTEYFERKDKAMHATVYQKQFKLPVHSISQKKKIFYYLLVINL